MLKSERKQFILEKVLKETFVSLDTLVQELGTSESTVRRDLDELEAESKLRRAPFPFQWFLQLYSHVSPFYFARRPFLRPLPCLAPFFATSL